MMSDASQHDQPPSGCSRLQKRSVRRATGLLACALAILSVDAKFVSAEALAHEVAPLGGNQNDARRTDKDKQRLMLERAAAGERARAQPDAETQALAQALEGQLIESRVAQLDHGDWIERARATEELRASDRVTLVTLEQMLAERRLSPEQRERLMDVARSKFMSSPRAAMGIRFFMAITSRVVIERTYPGFSAYDLLEPGDIIVSVDGVKLEGPASRPTMQSQIISRDPGEVLNLVVRRGKQTLNVQVGLGSFADLDQPNMSLTMLLRAWDARTQRFAPVVEGVRVPRVTAWMKPKSRANSQALAVRLDQQERPGAARVGAVQVAGGGVGRQVEDDALLIAGGQQAVIFRNNQVIMPNPRRGFAVFGGVGAGMMGGMGFEEQLPPPESIDDMLATVNGLEEQVRRTLQLSTAPRPAGGQGEAGGGNAAVAEGQGAQPGAAGGGGGGGEAGKAMEDALRAQQRALQLAGEPGLTQQAYFEHMLQVLPRVRDALVTERAETPPLPPQAQAEGG